ncbi:MAG TPA: cytochrome c biogenesis protein ResB [Pyrinomonadaceae bacterium]|nr:cytochrome c biogenesis protein ResB [Pyrinomonadaceae bacterium]
MSVAEETIKKSAKNAQAAQAKGKKSKPVVNSILDGLSSVRFGVSLLIIMALLSLIGMLVIQQNVQGFDNFYAAMTPAEKLVYSTLGFFDIYHAWYFNLLLLVLSLNIVLASIDRFPTAWSYIVKPKLEASRAYLLKEKVNAQFNLPGDVDSISKRVSDVFKKFGFKPRVTTKETGRVIIFGQKNVWNRLGAYVVHVALLTLFLGHFVALQTGFDADVRMMPGMTTNEIQLIKYNLDKQERAPVGLPFTLTCTDIEQKLIDKSGSIAISNTMDWATRMKISDPVYGDRDVTVSLNQPYTYRGFRFFQASAITQGSARNMTLLLTPENGEPVTVKLARNGTTTLPDGTTIRYQGFFPDFALVGGKPDTRSGEYNNPAVQLAITSPTGEQKMSYAFANDLPSGAPIGGAVFGYKYKLAEFEKSPLAHVLSIKYDPFYGSTIAWYYGGGLLMLALCMVFFFAHQRVWAVIEPNGEVTMGGHANRSELAFADKFDKIKTQLINRPDA